MKIAFCGDSFCADLNIGTWPFLVKKELDATSIWKGVQGANQYAILQDAKKIVHLRPDLIIFWLVLKWCIDLHHDVLSTLNLH